MLRKGAFFAPTTTCATVLSAVHSGVCGQAVITLKSGCSHLDFVIVYGYLCPLLAVYLLPYHIQFISPNAHYKLIVADLVISVLINEHRIKTS